MGKTKSTVKGSKATDPLSKVKNAGVTKASESPKAKSKQVAKDVAIKGVNGKEKEKKKSKKVVEPEPESESSESSEEEEDEEEEEDSDSESEASSDSESESEEEKPAKKAAPKDAKKKAVESESDSDSESEEEAPKAKANGVAKTNGAAKKESSDSDSDEEEDSDDSDSSEDEKDEKKAGASSDSDSSDSDEEEDSSDSKEASETEKKIEEPSKKRKALDDPVIPGKKARTDVSDKSSTLFVGSLAWAVDDNALYEAFQEFADLTGARVVTDKQTGRSRGFGYVDFANPEAAAAALEASQGKDLLGRAMNIDFSGQKPADSNPQARAADRAQRHGDSVSPESDTLFVGNLPFDVDQDAVRAFFSEVAEVTSVRLPTDPESGNLKGFGYVSFNSIEDAKSAYQQLNGQYVGEGRSGRAVRLDFAGAKPQRDGGAPRGRGGFGGRGGGRGGAGGRGGRGGGRGGRGGFSSTNRGGMGDFKGNRITF